MGWKPADKIAVALFNFDAQNGHHLSLRVGDLLYILEETPDVGKNRITSLSALCKLSCFEWPDDSNALVDLLQSGTGDTSTTSPPSGAFFPASFVKLKENTTVKSGSKRFVVPAEDEVALEAKEVLREWRTRLTEFYVSGSRDKYRQLLRFMEDVLSWRRNILHSSATFDVLQVMKTKLTAKIDLVNNQLKYPLSPRNENGKLLHCQQASINELFTVHQERAAEIAQQVSQTGQLHRKSSHAFASHMHHLCLQVGVVDHQFPEDCEIFFFLYDHARKWSTSERYMMQVVKSTDKARPHDQKKHMAVFTDLGNKDLDGSSIHLVCQIIRKGKMLLDDKKNVAHNPYRRPYACGVLDLVPVLQEKEDEASRLEDGYTHSFTMPLYLCSTNHESNFATFHTNVINKTGAKGGQKPGCAITVSLRTLHGRLAELKNDYPLLFTQSTEVVRKLGFPDIIVPGDTRNDIYVTLEHGQFEKGSKRAERNVEVSVEAVDNQGGVIPRAIILGAGTAPISEYESFIYYHNNTPKWNETFKLSIPFERLPDAHLRIGFRHVAKNEAREKADKTFAFTYMKIMKEDGSIVEDGTQELYVYKAEGKKWYDPRVYLHHPSCKEDVISQRSSRTYSSSKMAGNITSPPVQIPRSFRESIHVSTLTCSTKLTQRIELLLLLKWRQKQRDLKVVLTNVMHIDVEEVVKFLQDTLNCLFEILSTDSNKYGEHVFDTLVTIFSVMQAERYQHFTTVLDIYIKEHFSAVLTHKFLIHCFERNVISYYKVKELHPKLIRMFKSMEYLFKFMVQSHILYMSQQKQDDPEFRSDVKRTFQAFGSVMCVQENKMKGVYNIQSPLLQNLPRILPELARMFSEVDVIASLLSDFLNSIRNTHATLPGDKLDFILCLLNSPVKLLETEASYKFLVPTLVSHMISHMDHMMPRTNYKPEDPSNKNCLACIGRLLDIFVEKRETTTFRDIEHVVPLIFPLLRLCKVIPKTNPLAQPNLVNFIGLLDVMQDEHFATLFDSQKSTYENALKEFLMDLMRVLKNVITNPPYPNHWATLYLAQNRVMGKTLQNISKALLDGFLRATDFNPQIWDHFFNLCTVFLTQPCLQLESFSDFRRHQFQQQFGDTRLTVGRHVVVMWHALKEKKGNFIPDLIGSILEMTLLKQRELRRLSLPVVYDVMKCEQTASSNFKRVETEVFDKMDDLVSKGKGDEEYKEMFHDILIPLCSSGSQCPELEGPGTTFIDTVCRLIALLLDYRSVSADEHHKGRRMGCILNLLNFYREIEKEELYIRYIYRLAELHEHDQSYTEAGFTLLLHAKGLEWSSERLQAVGHYPEQTACERKERLYHDVIRLFDQGKTWECGVPLCKELAKIYETELFDYQQLASILQKEAEFFQKIIRELRVEPEYFMVGYYGKGFPLFLRNKVFIHRGQTYERLGSFIRRLTEEFSTAQILKTTTPPGADIQNSTGMHLQVRSVHPMAEEKELFKGKRVPDKITEYYRTNDVQKFRYDRPFHRGQKDPQCEFATLWIERTTFSTAQSFPGVISWFEVSSMETIELNPLDIALETLGSKNREIQTLTSQYHSNKTLNINPLSMLLNGVIDAAVMGGLSNYEKIFFNEMYLKEHPDHAEGVKKLRTLIEEQITILEKALSLHKQRIDTSLQGLHSKLETCFDEIQGVVFPERRKMSGGAHPAVKLSRAATLSRPLPPTPFQEPKDIPISLQAKRMSGTQTLPGKIVRRATGIPGKMKVHQVITEEPEPPKKPVKRSSTTRQNSQPGLNVPISSAYSPRKAHSPSPIRDGLEVAGGGRGLAGSRQSSTGSLDYLSEDDRNYEKLDDFLGGGDEGENRIRSIPSPAPTYPAPSLPNVPIVDHDYEPVILGSRLTPQASDSSFGYVEDEERTTLPLSFGSRTGMVVGAGLNTPPVKSASNLGIAESPPKAQERERSPSLPTVKEEVTEKKTLKQKKSWAEIPPEPTSPPPSPPRNIFSPTEAKEGKKPMPPHPIPSKLHTPSHQPAALDDDVYSFDRLEKSTEPEEPQPKLPPKLRKLSRPVAKDDEVYAFDTLDPKEEKIPEGGGIREDVYFDHLFLGQEEEAAAQVTNQEPAGVRGGGGRGGGVGEGVREGEGGGVGGGGGGEGGNEAYFDHLFGQVEGGKEQQDPGTPQGRGELQPQGGGQSEAQPQAGDAVYFDHLIEDQQLQQSPKKTPPAAPQPYTSYMPQASERSVSPDSSAMPPPVPLKRSKTTKQQTHGLAESPAGLSYLTEVEVGDRPKPVPRPRTNTIERNRLPSAPNPKDREEIVGSSPGDLTQVSTGRGPPAIPPKPLPPPTLPPSLPPKPSKPPLRPPRQEQNGDSQPPPIPSKPSKWKSSSAVKR